MNLVDLILRMKELGEEIEKHDEYIKALRVEYDRLRLIEIPASMAEANDMRSTTGAFGRCTLTADMHVKVEDKFGLHSWLEETGNGALIVPTVNAQTLKAFCKEQLGKRDGLALPDAIIKISPFVRAVLYKK